MQFCVYNNNLIKCNEAKLTKYHICPHFGSFSCTILFDVLAGRILIKSLF